MKYFKCGKCSSMQKIDENKVTRTQVAVDCTKCRAKNIIRFGPTLVIQTKNSIRQIPLKEGVNLIGRSAKAGKTDIRIDDKYISREHAEINIEKKDDKLFISIMDLGSTNGIFNNKKQKIEPKKRYPFKVNDYFTAGLTKLIFKYN